MTAPREEPVREFFSIGDVCALTDLKPHVLRYWESQFSVLHPTKNRSGNRVYTRRELEYIQLIKHLLYTEKYTLDGARRQLELVRKEGGLRAAARRALDVETLRQVEQDLVALLARLTTPDSSR